LVDDQLAPGPHTADWNGIDASGTRVASGVYLVVMETAGSRLSQKITMLK
jgi:hypothetical protein